MSLSKKQRIVLRARFGGRCAYCGEVLKEKGWHADHVEPVLRKSVQDMQAAARGKFKLKATGEVFNESANCLENLFPACAPCNLLKTTYSLEMFRKQISLQVERARKSSMNFRTAERFGQISIVEKPIVFWFEQYSEKNGAIK